MLIASLPSSTFPTSAAVPLFYNKFDNNLSQENNCVIGLKNVGSSGDNNQISFTAMSNNFINSDENNGNANVFKCDSENVDARSRFSHTKALFEQLERCNGDNIPSFYSPRLQRSSNKLPNIFLTTIPKTNIVAPVVPPKPITANHNFQQSYNAFDSKEHSNENTSSSQIAHNFSQFASDLEQITLSTHNVSSKIKNSTQSNNSKISSNPNGFADSFLK